jgi:uncharacterized membrane-anchored protein YjiN (DUF445 family)
VNAGSPSVAVAGPRFRREKKRRLLSTHLLWAGTLRVLQRMARYKRGESREFKLSFSVRDLLTDKGRLVKDQVEVFVQAVQKAGAYPAREEAARAVRAVMDALRDRVPPDVLLKLSESLPVREAARLRQGIAKHLKRESRRSRKRATSALGKADTGTRMVG